MRECHTAITNADPTGGARHHYLDKLGRNWSMVSYAEPLPPGSTAWTEEALAQVHSPLLHGAHSFGQAQPTLRWVKGDQIVDLYVEGLSTAEALAQMELELSLAKGGFVLSKRMGRILRPYLVGQTFAQGEVIIRRRRQQTPEQAKVWDGGGLVSRAMLGRMVLDPALDPAKRAKLERELAHVGRVEFTILTAKGQEKGHAIVVDRLVDDQQQPVDFLLPDDIKREVRSTNDATFVGFSVTHPHDHMRLDIQSLIHLYPFLDVATLLRYLDDEQALFLRALATGEVEALMQRIDPGETVEDVDAWVTRSYLARGGDPRWSASIMQALVNQHFHRLNEQDPAKVRLPVPGGRFYVMPAGVGQRGGVRGLHVPRGHIELDPEHGTAWVNDEDWLSLPDSPSGAGLAAIWGGADNDDGLWVCPFTDAADGEPKILAWCSPNQVGEYALLKPTAHSFIPSWETAAGPVHFPRLDSGTLPPRIDHQAVTYGNVIPPEPALAPQDVPAYSVGAMTPTVERIRQNKGVLGGFCNTVMLHQGVYAALPTDPPARMEEVVDADKKTGQNLQAVGAWCRQTVRRMLAQGERFPQRLIGRLVKDRTLPDWALVPPALKTGGDHWLDRLD